MIFHELLLSQMFASILSNFYNYNFVIFALILFFENFVLKVIFCETK